MIMVLSCCDLLGLVTNHPLTAIMAMLWLTEKVDEYPNWLDISDNLGGIFLAFSMLALLVMNFDRYLATYYPLFHRTSVTKGKLLTLLGILITIELALGLMSFNDFVISNYVHVAILLTIVAPPMFFINYKLFRVGRKNRMKKSFSPKNISSCLLCVACYVVLNIPVFVYIALAIASRKTPTLSDHDVKVASLWSRTVVTMSATCNCLIFYWKNKILRIEGMKLIKRVRICRRFRSRSDR